MPLDSGLPKCDIPIYFINLDDEEKRKSHIKKKLKRFGLSATRVSAVDAREISLKSCPNFQPNSYQNDRWEIDDFSKAVFESHRLVWKSVCKAGHPFAVILEDDLMFNNDFGKVLSLLGNFIEEFDIIRLNTFSQTKCFKNTQILCEGLHVRLILQSIADAGAYFITQAACQKLLQNSQSYCDHVDDYIFSPKRKLRSFQLVHPVCGQFIHQPEIANKMEQEGITISTRISSRTESMLPAKGPFLFRLKKEILRFYNKYRLQILVQNKKAVNERCSILKF